jgi:galactokinase/mevalonate kinase-like predicted kinase
MASVRLVVVEVRQSFYVGDVKEVESLLSQGWKIKACTAMGESKLIYTLVRN